MTSSNLWSDGNALAGPLHDVFRVDVTTTIGRCTACGRTGPMAEVRVFDHAPGVVARCPTCDQVLLRLVHGPGRAWLDLQVEDGDDGATLFRQTAYFHPRGLLGRLYWWSVIPFHGIVFGGMQRNIARAAEHLHREGTPTRRLGARALRRS